jgi:hypothetical protein
VIAPGAASGSTEHTGHSAAYPGGAALTMGGASSVPHDSQKLSPAPTGAPQDGQAASPPVRSSSRVT